MENTHNTSEKTTIHKEYHSHELLCMSEKLLLTCGSLENVKKTKWNEKRSTKIHEKAAIKDKL